MTTHESAHAVAGTATEAQVRELVRRVADEIHDPCSMAIGLNVGLAEMGLIREIAATTSPEGWRVRVQIRLTSPGCQYFFSFQEQLESRLLAHDGMSEVRVEWDEQFDWTPADMAASVRTRIDERNRHQHRLPSLKKPAP